jgi:predicted kinase
LRLRWRLSCGLLPGALHLRTDVERKLMAGVALDRAVAAGELHEAGQ